MIGFRQTWHYLLVMLVLFAFLIAGSFSLVGSHAESIRTASDLVRERFITHSFQPTQERLERAFATMHETARTISLLPSVRAIQGGNRASEDEDVVASGRFSADAWVTVQQLYNNLVTNLDVSEIYCVIEGFDPERGEVPFFMFDSLLIQQEQDGRIQEHRADPLLPEGSEEEEYLYYPKQIAYFKEHFPELHLESFDDVPAVFSSPLRTCDNRQYHSKSVHDVQDTQGVLYSVPFYGEHNQMRGLISVILRTNVLEAILLDVPFLIITDRDRAEAISIGFSMPDKKNNYVLHNRAHGISIVDRRNEGFVETLEQIERDRPEEVVSATLDSYGDSEWTLLAAIDPKAYEEAFASQDASFKVELKALLITLAILIMGVALALRERCQNLRKVDQIASFRREIAEGEGDLTLRLSDSGNGELASLAGAFNGFIASLQKMMQEVAIRVDRVSDAANGLFGVAADVSSVTRDQFEKIGDATQAMNKVTLQVDGITESTQELTASVDESTTAAVQIKGVSEQLSAKSDRLFENVSSSDCALQQMIDNIHHITLTTERLSAAVLEVAKGVEEIDQQVSQIEEGAVETSRLSDAVISAAEKGRGRVENAIERMQVISKTTKAVQGAIGNLNKRVNEIENIVDIISSVADETDLLAFNAAVISANAGEHGRAFGVISSQIKKLAERVADNTNEIGGLIRNLQSDRNDAIAAIELGVSHTESGVEVSSQAGQSLEEITVSAIESGKQIERIVLAVNEHQCRARQMVERIESVRADAQEIQSSNERRITDTNIVERGIQSVGVLTQDVQSTSLEQTEASSFIARRLEDITGSVSGIHRALRKQAKACRQTEDFLVRLRKRTEANEQSTASMNAALKGVLEQAEKLRKGIHRFRF